MKSRISVGNGVHIYPCHQSSKPTSLQVSGSGALNEIKNTIGDANEIWFLPEFQRRHLNQKLEFQSQVEPPRGHNLTRLKSNSPCSLKDNAGPQIRSGMNSPKDGFPREKKALHYVYTTDLCTCMQWLHHYTAQKCSVLRTYHASMDCPQ